MSDTPRTDAEPTYKTGIAQTRTVNIDFARQLERELAAAISSIDEERERAQREGARVIKLQVELAEAVAAERERCARVCEERGSFNSMYAHHILTGAAEAIRKGEKESLTVEARKPVPEFELIEKWEGE